MFALTLIPSQIAIRDLSPTGFIALRFAVSALILAPFAIRSLDVTTGKQTLLMQSILLGAAGQLAIFLFQVNGLRFTTTSNSAFISSLSIIVLPILVSIWTRRMPALASVAGIVL